MNELGGPKDEHVEETTLPATTTNEVSKLNTTAAETETVVNATPVASEVASSEAKID